MNYTLECLEKFEELSAELKDVFGGDRAFKLTKDLENQYGVDLNFVLVLLAINELIISDVPEYLKKKFGLSPEKTNLIVKEINENIIKPASELISEETEIEKINIIDLIISVFSENIFLLFSYSEEDIKNFNITSLAAFNENDMLEEKVIEAFYNNQELISKEKIIIENKEKSATIANFLKDFIKTHGSDMPDNLLLANYLNSSKNVSKLKESEKNILNRVLKTYRNLVFFPESMEGIPMKFWEIIPVKGRSQDVLDVLSENKEIDFDKSLKNKINQKKLIENRKIEEKKEKSIKEIKGQELEEIEKRSASELKKIIQDYSKDSLGYRAIKQELDRLEKSKKN
jgi:hypothetical protein